MDPVMQIHQSPLHALLVLLPRLPVHSWRSLPLQRVVAVPEQADGHMVQQRGELLLPIPAGCFPHTFEPLGHAFPTLCPERVSLFGVPLGRTASLHALRRRWLFVVRALRWCRVGGGALARWPPSAAQTVRAVFPHTAFTKAQTTRYDPGPAEWGQHRTCQVDQGQQSPRTMMYGFFPKELIHLTALTRLTSLLFPPAFVCRLPRPTPVADCSVTRLSPCL